MDFETCVRVMRDLVDILFDRTYHIGAAVGEAHRLMESPDGWDDDYIVPTDADLQHAAAIITREMREWTREEYTDWDRNR
jgi:hypothetical protein